MFATINGKWKQTTPLFHPTWQRRPSQAMNNNFFDWAESYRKKPYVEVEKDERLVSGRYDYWRWLGFTLEL